MRFHYAESMTTVANYLPLARAAEEMGFAGFTIPDSLIYPKASDTYYSYTQDGGREFLENKPFVESFVLAAAIGAAHWTRLFGASRPPQSLDDDPPPAPPKNPLRFGSDQF